MDAGCTSNILLTWKGLYSNVGSKVKLRRRIPLPIVERAIIDRRRVAVFLFIILYLHYGGPVLNSYALDAFIQ